MTFSRRRFIKKASCLASATVAGSAMPNILFSKGFGPSSKYVNITGAENSAQLVEQSRIDKIVQRAIDVATSLGATFADARVTRTVAQYQQAAGWSDTEFISIGVRVFVKGVWGFAASPYVDMEEAGILANSAVDQAKTNSLLFPRDIDLGKYPVVTGSWTTPIEIDPFSIPMEDRSSYINSFTGLTPHHVIGREYAAKLNEVSIRRTEKTVATSEGSIYSQCYYVTGGTFGVALNAKLPSQPAQSGAGAKDIFTQGAGWELFDAKKIRDQIPLLIEEAEKGLYMPIEPVEIGRYEMVASAGIAAAFVAASLGGSTQLDRVLGYHANSSGTSYFGPDHMSRLGTSIGSSKLTVTANRSMPRGLHTTKWDDEGVAPDDFTIVDQGVFVDYQTTRETAGFLTDWYKKQGKPVRSHGCCSALTALHIPSQGAPNLVMEPDDGASSLMEMIANTERGIAFLSGRVGTDFQSLTGQGSGHMREIRNGKLGALLIGAEVIFSSLELWESLLEVGNGESTQQFGNMKAQPIRLKDMAITDGKRQA